MIFDLDGCVIDTDAYELRRGGETVRVEPQVFDLLLLLVEHRDRVVTKAEITERVWHGRSVSEAALSSRIKAARKALGDDGQSQNFIRTVRGRGFRYIGPVAEAQPAAPEKPAPRAKPPGGAKPSIAVLPFANLSDDPDDLYFSDGITEDIITELSRPQTLDVAARNSSFVYRGQAVDVRQVGAELGVDFVLEGSIRKLGANVRITAQLIDAQSGNHLWAERYDRELASIFEIQDEIIGTIVATLTDEIANATFERLQRASPNDWRAYDYYLAARQASQQARTVENLDRIMDFSRRAVDADPGYAPGYSMLSNAHRWRAQLTCCGDDNAIAEAYGLAHENALKAVALDPGDSESQRALGWSHLIRRNFAEAERCLARAYALNPHDGDIVMTWVTALAYLGRAPEAVALAEQTIRRTPAHPSYYLFDLGEALFFAGEHELASATFDRTPNEELDENFAVVVAAYAQAGRMRTAAMLARRYIVQLNEMWVGPPKAALTERINWEFAHRHVFRRMKDAETLRGGLRKAGLPA